MERFATPRLSLLQHHLQNQASQILLLRQSWYLNLILNQSHAHTNTPTELAPLRPILPWDLVSSNQRRPCYLVLQQNAPSAQMTTLFATSAKQGWFHRPLE